MRILITISMLILFFSGCEESFDQELNYEAGDLIVVEGLLTNQLKRHRVKLTKPYGQQNQTVEPITNAFVAIVNSDEDVVLLTEEPVGSGEYFTTPMRAVTGKFYLLVIRYNGNEYQAFDTPPGGQFLEDIILDSMTIEGIKNYSIVYQETGTTPHYVTHDIDWSATTYCSPQESCQGKIVFYDLKNIDVQEIFAPDKEDFYFPEGSMIIRNKYSISNRYQEFLRSLLSETEWRGGFFDITRDNIPTNISEGGVGFFATVTVDSDTVVVNF